MDNNWVLTYLAFHQDAKAIVEELDFQLKQ